MTEGTVCDSASGADATGLSHPGGLLFVHESELDNEIDASAVGDAPPVDEAALHEVETVSEQQPAEVPEPVGVSVYRQGGSADGSCYD